MYKLEVKLKQHTPLVHFQHDQEGATLRASEVKPKLDKFIINKYKESNKSFEHLLSGNGNQNSLNYKIVIESDPVLTTRIQDRFPLYFGNMGDENERKEFRFCEGITRIIFKTFHEEIINCIRKFLVEFLLLNNFGTRQSKGFGSFFIDKSDPLYQRPLDTQIMDFRFRTSISGSLQNQWEKLFDQINLFYCTLRRGINTYNKSKENTFYIKPVMFKYAKEKGYQWDKKSIKESYYPGILSEQQNDHEDSDVLHFSQDHGSKYLFKDLLGLSSNENWKFPYNKTISKSSPEIDRFKSPIIFKPIRINDEMFNVFFKGINIDKNYLNKDISIKSNNTGNLVLKTYPGFDIEEFLDFAIFQVNLKELLGNEEYEDHPTFKTIDNIFSQIRKDYE